MTGDYRGTMGGYVLRIIGRGTLSMAQVLAEIRKRRRVKYPSEFTSTVLDLAAAGVLVRTWDDKGEPFYTRA